MSEPGASVIDLACSFLDTAKATLREKNRAYGDSAGNPIRVFSSLSPEAAIRVRIDDKLSRIARGDGSGNEDAELDLIGYLALLRGVRCAAEQKGSEGK